MVTWKQFAESEPELAALTMEKVLRCNRRIELRWVADSAANSAAVSQLSHWGHV